MNAVRDVVVLESDITSLHEVVVTGYTAQLRRDLTGSVGVVESAKLTAVSTGNVSNSLQGRTSMTSFLIWIAIEFPAPGFLSFVVHDDKMIKRKNKEKLFFISINLLNAFKNRKD